MEMHHLATKLDKGLFCTYHFLVFFIMQGFYIIFSDLFSDAYAIMLPENFELPYLTQILVLYI
jgi:hypothetical protein